MPQIELCNFSIATGLAIPLLRGKLFAEFLSEDLYSAIELSDDRFVTGNCPGTAGAQPRIHGAFIMTNSTLPIITYGDRKVDTASLPEKSIEALLRRGVTHYLGNEQASKVTAKIEAAIKKAAGADDFVVIRDDIKKYREANSDQVSLWMKEVTDSALAALLEGTIGNRAVGASGPKLAPLDTIVRKVAKAEVIDTLKANGLSTPKGEEKVQFDGGKSFTLDELIDRRIAKHGDRLTAAAKKELAERARKAKQAAEAGVSDLID